MASKSTHTLHFGQQPIPISRIAAKFPVVHLTNDDLAAMEEIRQTLNLYLYTVDSLDSDFSAFSKIFVEDVVTNYGPPLNVLTPLSTLQTTLEQAVGKVRTQHITGTQSIRMFESKKEAFSVTYFRAHHFPPEHPQTPVVNPSESVLTALGQYQDQWVKTQEGWRIAHRNLVYMVSSPLRLGSWPCKLKTYRDHLWALQPSCRSTLTWSESSVATLSGPGQRPILTSRMVKLCIA